MNQELHARVGDVIVRTRASVYVLGVDRLLPEWFAEDCLRQGASYTFRSPQARARMLGDMLAESGEMEFSWVVEEKWRHLDQLRMSVVRA